MAQKKLKHSQWREKDTSYYLHPFSEYKKLAEDKDCRVISHAEGVFIYDVDGKQYLDGMSGLWCNSLGFTNPSIADAVSRQLNTLPFYNSFFKTSNYPAIELAEKIISLAPTGMKQVFFTSSGSEAIDTLIRMARHFWTLQNKPNKQIIIGRKNAYHGSTMGGASLGGMAFMHAQGGLPIPNIVHIEQPYYYELGAGEEFEAFGKRMAGKLEEKIKELGQDNVAAFVGEPVQGAGGVIIPPKSYWLEIEKICQKYEILLCADEVITGFGRLGEWFGSIYYSIKPDIMVFAKGVTAGYLPLGGIIVGEKMSSAFMNSEVEFSHGFTYSGHPTCCAAALEAIRLLETQDLIKRVREEIGPYYQEKLRALEDHRLVGETRAIGLISAVELVKDKTSRGRYDNKFTMGTTCRDICVANGLISRAVRDTMVIAPPFIITEREVDMLFEKMTNCLDMTAERLKL